MTRYVADGAATVALGDDEAAAPEKRIGLFASRESVRAQQLARGDLMGHRNRVLRGQVLTLRRQAVVSAPSSRWHPVTDDEPYGFLDVCPGDAPWDHGSLRSLPSRYESGVVARAARDQRRATTPRSWAPQSRTGSMGAGAPPTSASAGPTARQRLLAGPGRHPVRMSSARLARSSRAERRAAALAPARRS